MYESETFACDLTVFPRCNLRHNTLKAPLKVVNVPFEDMQRSPSGRKAFRARTAEPPLTSGTSDEDLQAFKSGAMPCFKPAPLQAKNVYGLAHVAVLDLDEKTLLDAVAALDLRARLMESPLAFSMWESLTSRIKGYVKVHILFPLARPAANSFEYQAICEQLAAIVSVPVGDLDHKCMRISQPIGTPLRRDPMPLDCLKHGDLFRPDLQELEARVSELRSSVSQATQRVSLEDMGKALRAFNERVAEGGLHLLNEYSEIMGCRYIEASPDYSWTWVGLDGETASLPGHITRTTGSDYLFTDYSASTPLTSAHTTSGATAVYPHEILLRQAALHHWGLDSLSDREYQDARREWLDPILFPERAEAEAERQAAVMGLLSREDRPALAEFLVAHLQHTKDGRPNWGATLGGSLAEQAWRYSRVLDDVVSDPSGVAFWVQQDGTRRAIAGSNITDALRTAVRSEAYQGLGDEHGVVTLPVDFVDHMIGCRVQSAEAQVDSPKMLALSRCRRAWVDAGRPEPLSLFGGIVPGMASQDDWTRAAFLRLLRASVLPSLLPGSKVGMYLPFLVGGQNSGKSQLIEALGGGYLDYFPPGSTALVESGFFTEGEGAQGSRIQRLADSVLVEAGEMQGVGLNGRASTAMKNFVTSSTYNIVPKFQAAQDVPRSFFMVATANNGDSVGLVPADDGVRRYAVLEMVSQERAGHDAMGRAAYQQLSRLVSPTSRERGHLSEMLIGWSVDQVLSAKDDYAELHARVDADWVPGGRWYEESVRRMTPYASHQDLRYAMLTTAGKDMGDGMYLVRVQDVVRSVKRSGPVSSSDAAAVAWHAKSLGGRSVLNGQGVVYPASYRVTEDSTQFDPYAAALLELTKTGAMF